ncbi:uncharacterized protein PV09_09381 [Verruconis gallopava]|uniref:Uncharacterized protein n=1 Tax=Verruconis gallopava TaxID=253628 RepID=A0A0D1ZWH5_9PEZI|nr:uncharacterized protein PV09_09381 [Verruconis gallopava]KIV98852.1 hypothetical protein PV09_09381 [Verruconis gallopava]
MAIELTHSHRTGPPDYSGHTIATHKIIKRTKQDIEIAKDLVQKNLQMGKEAKTAAQEAAIAGKTAVGLVKEIKHKAPQQASILLSYAAVTARGMLAASIHSPQNAKAPSAQIKREVIMKIRDLQTIKSL